MRVAVVGGGHGGCHAAAAHLSDQGHEVRFWRRDASSFAKILTGKKISIKDYRGTRDVEIHAPTVDLAEAISGAELVVVPLPSTTHDSLATLIAPFLEEGQVVFLPPALSVAIFCASTQQVATAPMSALQRQEPYPILRASIQTLVWLSVATLRDYQPAFGQARKLTGRSPSSRKAYPR